jgi:arginine/ornithine transport system substrate-binding protein
MWRTSLAAGVLLAVASSAGIATADQEKLQLRVATEGAYAPFNWIDANGQLTGFDVEIGKALCEAMNAECTWVANEWDSIIPGLLAEKYDAIIASMYMTPPRKEKVLFTNKYYEIPTRFVAEKGKEYEFTREGLEGVVVGVQGGTPNEEYLKDNYADVVEIRRYDTYHDAFYDLSVGRVDMVLGNKLTLKMDFLDTDLGQGFDFVGPELTDPRWFGEGAGIALRKGDLELRERFNEAIVSVRESGTYDAIRQKYFPMDIYGPEK